MRLEQVVGSLFSRQRWGRLGALGLILAAGACYPGDGPTNVEDLDLVITLHDEDVNFGGFQTFAMPDTVLHVSNDTLGNLIPVPRTHDELVLDLVASNMSSAGYTRELDPTVNGADLIMLVSAIATEQTEYWGYYDWYYWWGWYPGWGYPGYPPYDPGYGWYYPPTYVGSVTFEQGSVVLTLVDPNAADGESLPVIWSGVVKGLMNYGGGDARITDGINQAFSQSPYLSR